MLSTIVHSVGIDVSKDSLDVCIRCGPSRRFANSRSGLMALSAFLPSQSRVVVEATGGYERKVYDHLSQSGFEVGILNPRKVLRLGDSLGFTAKTDACDARLLAEAGAVLPWFAAKDAGQYALCSEVRRREGLSVHLGDLRKKLSGPVTSLVVVASIEREIEFILGEIRQLDAAIRATMKSTGFYARYRLLCSIRCIGEVSAMVLACELPLQVHEYSTSQLCSYAGLAPIDDSSGRRTGARRIRHGNGHMKRVLYMAGMSALQHRPALRLLYDRLRSAGKPHQQAIVAVMHKLLKEAIGVLRRGTNWTEQPPMT